MFWLFRANPGRAAVGWDPTRKLEGKQRENRVIPTDGASLKGDEDFLKVAPPVGGAAGEAVGKVPMIARARPADGADGEDPVGSHQTREPYLIRPLQDQSDDFQQLQHTDGGPR